MDILLCILFLLFVGSFFFFSFHGIEMGAPIVDAGRSFGDRFYITHDIRYMLVLLKAFPVKLVKGTFFTILLVGVFCGICYF